MIFPRFLEDAVNASDLLVLMLSSVPLCVAAALFWITVTEGTRDDVLLDENLLAAIRQHEQSSNDRPRDWSLSR